MRFNKNKFGSIISIIFILTMIVAIILGTSPAYAKDDDDDKTPKAEDAKIDAKAPRLDSDNYKSDKEKEQEQKDLKGVGSEGSKNANLEDSDIWNIYAQFIMTDKEKKEKKKKKEDKKKWPIHRAYDGAQAGIIGDGGVQLKVPYNKMNSLANEVRGNNSDDEKDNAGSQMASFLATYNHYGYISTNSGQKALNAMASKGSGLVKGIFGTIIGFALVINMAVEKILEWLVKAMVDLNPLTLIGLDDTKVATDNPVSKMMKNFFSNIGFNPEHFEKVQSIGIMVIAFVFLVTVILALASGKVHQVKRRSRKFLVSLFTVVIGIPLVLFMSKDLGEQIKDYQKTHSSDANIVSQYLLNARGWAASSNLSPSGLEGSEFPDSTAKDGYVDEDFDPIRSRKLIEGINKHTYETLYSNKEDKAGFDLLGRWMKNDSFDVNTYIGDINRGDLFKEKVQLPAFDHYQEEFGKKGNKPRLQDIEYSMWTATQNVDKELREVSNENFKKDSNTGVRDDNSFSTQSVVLMLQSSFDSNQADFYANNIGPTGVQGKIKSVTTVKTNWQEVTLPGDGTFGVVGSYIAMGSQAISYAIIQIALILALFTVNFLEAFKRMIVRLYQALFGDAFALVSLAIIIIAGMISLALTFKLAKTFLSLVDDFASVFDKVTGGFIPSGFIDILVALVKVITALWLSFGKKVGQSKYPPIKYIMSIPFQVVFSYDDRLRLLSHTGNKDFKGAYRELGHVVRQGGRTNIQELSGHTRGSARGVYTGGVGGFNGARNSIRRNKANGKLGKYGMMNAKDTAKSAIQGTKYGFNEGYNEAYNRSVSNTSYTNDSLYANSPNGTHDGLYANNPNSTVEDESIKNTRLHNVSVGGHTGRPNENGEINRNNIAGYTEEDSDKSNVASGAQPQDQSLSSYNRIERGQDTSRDSYRDNASSTNKSSYGEDMKDVGKDVAVGYASGKAVESGVDSKVVDGANTTNDVASVKRNMDNKPTGNEGFNKNSSRGGVPPQNTTDELKPTHSSSDNSPSSTQTNVLKESGKQSKGYRNQSVDKENSTHTHTTNSRSPRSNNSTTQNRKSNNRPPNKRVRRKQMDGVDNKPPQTSNSKQTSRPKQNRNNTQMSTAKPKVNDKVKTREVRTEVKQPTDNNQTSTNKQSDKTTEVANRNNRNQTKRTTTRKTRRHRLEEKEDTSNSYNRIIKRRKRR